MSTMDTLKQRRAVIKGSITRIYTYCRDSKATVEGMRERSIKLDDYFKEMENVQEKIDENIMSEEEVRESEQYREQVENLYYSIKETMSRQFETSTNNDQTVVDSAANQHQIATVMDTLARNQTTLSAIMERLSTDTSTPLSHVNNNTSTHQNMVQLPRIKLPEFDGQYTNWIRFRDLFVSIIHERENLSNIEKFEYLQAHVKGDALVLIKHLNLSNENYIVAWELIKQKYNNDTEIKNNYMKILFDQPNMKGPYAAELKRLLNNINEAVNALKALNENTEQWNSILLFNLVRKLDVESQTLWYRASTDNATITTFLEFLQKRLRELELFNNNKPSGSQQVQKIANKWSTNIHTSTKFKPCPVCQQTHLLYSCSKFRGLNISDRINIVKNNNVCFNCLQYDHRANTCRKSSCRICHEKHNTLLHKDNSYGQSSFRRQTVQADHEGQAASDTVHINSVHALGNNITLLPTAIILIKNANSDYQPCRVLLDTGAQASLISESCVQRLKLKRSYDKTILCGVGLESKSYTKGKVDLFIKPCKSNNEIKITALCLQHLTQFQPAFTVSSDDLEYYKHLQLADQNFNVSGPIDMILGADVLTQCFLNDKIPHPSGSSAAFLTIFGWVIIGNIATNQKSQITIAHSSIDLSTQLQNFWEIEEVGESKHLLTEEEQLAENYYQKTVTRDNNGKYVVRLPFKDENVDFGDTKMQAIKRMNNMEARFAKNNKLKDNYQQFINEYINLNHMELIQNTDSAKYYLPHHAVMKMDSTTTKLRVVFDGSAKGTNGESLNDKLLIGPTIQNDIFTIILQFRKYKIALSGDIEKMYRQIWIHPMDREYQCIVWRENNHVQMSTYQLKTITYGTSAAPFLAIRTLKQIAIDNKKQQPIISNIILNSFYVDDFMSSTNTTEEAIELRLQLCNILSKSGLNLRKWSSNSSEVIESIDEKDRETSPETIIEETHTVKTLGLYWQTNSDTFKYSVTLPELQTIVTKREVLSIISRVFDPLGWLAPFVIILKTFMQKLWLRGLDWDSQLPDDLLLQWQEIYKNISYVTNIQVPRWLQYSNEISVQLHGFADSSEIAYAAVVYLRVTHDNGLVTTRIITSKSRVAPVKQVTLPRLELCACHLLVKLLLKVKAALGISNIEMYGWSDSTIVLAWLSDHPRKWKNFVANRTSYIISTLPAQYWRHITSTKNPADLATRGLSPKELEMADLWWHGPDVLNNFDKDQHTKGKQLSTEFELRNKTVCHINEIQQNDLLHLYSDYMKLLRVTAMIIRFITNCQSKNNPKQVGFLTTKELKHAHNILIKQSQTFSFSNEIKMLSAKNQLSPNHKLAALTPFIGTNGIMRVGGRISNANISYDQMHPIILSKDCVLTKLIVQWYHIKYLHAGTRQLQYLLGLKYWIPSIIYIVKGCVYKCIKCMRYRNRPFGQQMGNLPKHRLQGSRAFENVGIDFAGPLLVRSWKGRGSKQYKAWISLFVCLATKAIHLELVTYLTTDAFIASLRRFVARRGKPQNIYSDNGTNFVGANKQLKDLQEFMLSDKTQEKITSQMTENGIQWHFIPPASPNFGGLWEAGVKSVKNHINRVLGNAAVTYEEMSTLLCQIEQCLNSRPLTAKFVGDVDPLTPAHFLIGQSTDTVPDNDVTNISPNRLNRWQYLQQLMQTFWKKWQTEYLSQLQSRPKWKTKCENLKINDVVFIKDDQSPPCKWPIGKIIETHSGQDGLVRVVTVKTQKGVFKKPISKLCPLVVDL